VSGAEAALAEFARVLAPFVAREVVRELRAGSENMIAQAGSPLGPRRHAAAVRKRVANSQGGAVIAGRRLLLSREALAEEMATLSCKRPAKPVAPAADFAAKYGFRKVGWNVTDDGKKELAKALAEFEVVSADGYEQAKQFAAPMVGDGKEPLERFLKRLEKASRQ
jgi:hypothetical protein